MRERIIFTTETQRGVAATKSEARNSKLETNSNDQNSNDLNKLGKGYAKILTKFQEIDRSSTEGTEKSKIE